MMRRCWRVGRATGSPERCEGKPCAWLTHAASTYCAVGTVRMRGARRAPPALDCMLSPRSPDNSHHTTCTHTREPFPLAVRRTDVAEGMGWDGMRWMDKVRLLRTALLASIHLHAGMQREHTSTVKPRADRSGQPTYIHTDSLAAGCLSWSSSAIGSGTRSRSCGFMKQDTHTRAHAYAHAKSIGGREGPWGHM